MNETIKTIAAVLQVLALIVAGGWAYWKFIHQRMNEPAADIDIDLKFVGKQDGKWIIEITENGTFVWVQCKFLFTPQKNVKMNSQRIFRVPAGEVTEIAAIKPASALL